MCMYGMVKYLLWCSLGVYMQLKIPESWWSQVVSLIHSCKVMFLNIDPEFVVVPVPSVRCQDIVSLLSAIH
jgi:hypothetical protein